MARGAPRTGRAVSATVLLVVLAYFSSGRGKPPPFLSQPSLNETLDIASRSLPASWLDLDDSSLPPSDPITFHDLPPPTPSPWTFDTLYNQKIVDANGTFVLLTPRRDGCTFLSRDGRHLYQLGGISDDGAVHSIEAIDLETGKKELVLESPLLFGLHGLSAANCEVGREGRMSLVHGHLLQSEDGLETKAMATGLTLAFEPDLRVDQGPKLPYGSGGGAVIRLPDFEIHKPPRRASELSRHRKGAGRFHAMGKMLRPSTKPKPVLVHRFTRQVDTVRDDMICSVGGRSSAGDKRVQTRVDCYSPRLEHCLPLPDLPSPRELHSAHVLSADVCGTDPEGFGQLGVTGCLVVLGGRESDEGTETDTIIRLPLYANSPWRQSAAKWSGERAAKWETPGRLTRAKASTSSVMLSGDTILIAGGTQQTEPDQSQILYDVEACRVSPDGIVCRKLETELTVPRYGASIALRQSRVRDPDGVVFICGGVTAEEEGGRSGVEEFTAPDCEVLSVQSTWEDLDAVFASEE